MQLWWLQETKCLRQSHVCVSTYTHTRSFTRSRQLLSLLHSCIWLRSADRLERISLRCGRQAVLIILRSTVDPRLNICICVFLNYDIALVTYLSQGWVQRCAAWTSTWRCGLCEWCPLVLVNGSEVAHGCRESNFKKKKLLVGLPKISTLCSMNYLFCFYLLPFFLFFFCSPKTILSVCLKKVFCFFCFLALYSVVNG